MQVELDFSGSNDEVRLVEFCLRISPGSGTKPLESITLTLEEQADRAASADSVFTWQPGLRALMMLLLDAYSRGSPYAGSLDGESHSPAQSLYEVLSDKEVKGGGQTWIQRMFCPAVAKPDQTNAGPLPRTLFFRYSRGQPRLYHVELGEYWRRATLKIRWHSRDVDSSTATLLAAAITEQDQRRRRQMPPPRIAIELGLNAWDPNRTVFEPIESLRLPLAIDRNIQVTIRLNFPSYLLVVWRSGTGTIQPLFPHQKLSWGERPVQSEITEVVLPDQHLGGDPGAYPLATKSGVETLLVLASTRPVEAEDVKTLLTALSRNHAWFPRSLPDPKRIWPVVDRRASMSNRTVTRLGSPYSITSAPLSQLAEGILQSVGYAFGSIAGLAFCTQASR